MAKVRQPSAPVHRGPCACVARNTRRLDTNGGAATKASARLFSRCSDLPIIRGGRLRTVFSNRDCQRSRPAEPLISSDDRTPHLIYNRVEAYHVKPRAWPSSLLQAGIVMSQLTSFRNIYLCPPSLAAISEHVPSPEFLRTS